MRLFTIPPQQDFLACLAQTILARQDLARVWPEVQAPPPEAWTIFVPTQRARTKLTQAFLAHQNMTPLLLPKLVALGDSDEAVLGAAALDEDMLALSPAVSPQRRHWFMLQRVWQLGRARKLVQTPEQAAAPAPAQRAGR